MVPRFCRTLEMVVGALIVFFEELIEVEATQEKGCFHDGGRGNYRVEGRLGAQ